MAHQIEDAAASGRPRGNLSDLYPRWLGTRELLLHGRDPYSDDITREIQAGYYGRVLDPNRPGDPKDQQGFVYPVYVALLLAPTVHWQFHTVQTFFRWALILLTVGSVFWWLRGVSWRLTCWQKCAATLLVVGSFSFVQAYKLQQLTLLVCALLAGASAALVAGLPLLAGFLLAVATIKPQVVTPLLFVLLVWTLADWRARQRWFGSFVATMIVFEAGSELLLPGWIPRFLAALRSYQQYAGRSSLLEGILPGHWHVVVWMCLLLCLLAGAWRLRRERIDSPMFALGVAWTLSITLLLIPMFAGYNQMLLLPGVFYLTKERAAIRKGSLALQSGGILLAVALSWPWSWALVLDAGAVLFPQVFLPKIVQGFWAVPLYPTLVLPLLVFALLTLQLWRRKIEVE